MKQWITTNRQLLISIAVLIAIIAIVHPAPVFQGSVYISGDARNADAFTVAGNEVLKDGEYPQWNPYLFGGMPTFGSATYNRFVYFPSELFNFLQSKLNFPPMTWMIAHLLFGGIGMMFLLARWNLPLYSRLLGATIWLLFPKVIAWGVHGHGSKLGAVMFIPWIVAFTIDLLDGKGKRKAGLLALFLGIQFLRGHPQISYYTLLTVGVLLLGNWISTIKTKQWKQQLPRTGLLLLAIVAGLLVGAAMLWPSHQYADFSIRGGNSGGGSAYDFATGWSLSPHELGTFVFPSIAGFGKLAYQGGMPFNDYPNYFGIFALLLTVTAFINRREKYSWSLFAIAILSILLSFGKFFPLLYDLLFNYLPFFNKFRVPSMVLILTGLATAIMAAIGLARVSQSKFSLKIAGIMTAISGLVLLVLASDFARPMFESVYNSIAESCGRNVPHAMLSSIAWDTHSADLFRIGLLLLVAGGLLLFSTINNRFRTGALPWVLLCLIVIDYSAVNKLITSPQNGLFNYNQRLVKAGSPVREFTESNIDAAPEFIEMADTIGHQRIWPLGRMSAGNEPMFASIRSLGGYHAAKTSSFELIRRMLIDPELPAGRVASWMGAEYLLLDQRLPIEFVNAFTSLGAELDPNPTVYKSMFLYKNNSALPRARLVGQWELAKDGPAVFLERLQAGSVSTDVVRLNEAPSVMPEKSNQPYSKVEYVHDGSNSVELKTSSEKSAILVLADIWSPGWSVTVDGEKATLLVADHFVRAVALPAGDHDVVFRFNDPSLRQGIILSLIGLMIALGLLVPWKKNVS